MTTSTNPWEHAVSAFTALGAALTEAQRQVEILLDRLWNTIRYEAATEYAVEYMGIARCDIRYVSLDDPRHPPHVKLWNHRRIPFPPDWSAT